MKLLVKSLQNGNSSSFFENIVEIKNSKDVNWLIRDVFVFDDNLLDRRDKWLTSGKETVKKDVYCLIELSKLQYLSVKIR